MLSFTPQEMLEFLASPPLQHGFQNIFADSHLLVDALRKNGLSIIPGMMRYTAVQSPSKESAGKILFTQHRVFFTLEGESFGIMGKWDVEEDFERWQKNFRLGNPQYDYHLVQLRKAWVKDFDFDSEFLEGQRQKWRESPHLKDWYQTLDALLSQRALEQSLPTPTSPTFKAHL